MKSNLDPSIAVQTCQEISDACQDLGQIIPCFDGAVLFNLDSLLLNLQDVSSPFLDILQSTDGQAGIFCPAWTFLKPVLPQMELIWSVIKGVRREAGALDFLIHFNWMLQEKASKNTILMLSELLETIKLIRVDVFLMEQLKYKANLMVPAKEQILGLHEGVQLLRLVLASVKKMNRLLSASLIEKIKNVKVEEGTTMHLHVFGSSGSNWPRTDELGLGYLRMLLNCRTDLIVSGKCQIEVLLRHLKSETIRVTGVGVGLNDQLEVIINQLRRRSFSWILYQQLACLDLEKQLQLVKNLSFKWFSYICSIFLCMVHCFSSI